MNLSSAIHDALQKRLSLEKNVPITSRSHCQVIIPTFTATVKRVLQDTDPSINYISIPFPRPCGKEIQEHLEKEQVITHISPIIHSIDHANTVLISFNLEKKRSMVLLSEH